MPLAPSRADSTSNTDAARVLVCDADRARAGLLADVISTHCQGLSASIIDPADDRTIAAHAPHAAAAVCACGPTAATRFDALGRIAHANPAIPALALIPADLPRLAHEVLRIGAADALLTAPGYLDQLPLAVTKMLRAAESRRIAETRHDDAQRELVALRGENRTLAHTIDRLELLAATDPLTGLANRRTIDARLNELLSAANRHDLPLSVLAVDVDGLKIVNDTLGHAAGDDVLEIVADILHGACRTSDVAGRTGGDEFIVILPHTEAQRAMVVAERAIRAFAQRIENVRERIRAVQAAERGVVQVVGRRTQRPGAPIPGLSIGIAARESGLKVSAERLLANADDALYRAKLGGRGRAMTGNVQVVVRQGDRAAA